ncbi:MAG: hypothetical protein ACFCU6_13535, partial [Balneolaceae bacterium]
MKEEIKQLFLWVIICFWIPAAAHSQLVLISFEEYEQWGNILEAVDQNQTRFAYDRSGDGRLLRGIFKISESSDVKAIAMEKFNSTTYGELADG